VTKKTCLLTENGMSIKMYLKFWVGSGFRASVVGE